jgi:uncharacterized membrane protein YhaH (DUF805 family)
MAIERILLPGGRIGRGPWWIGTLVVVGLTWVAGRSLYALFGDALFAGTAGRLALLGTSLALVWAAGALAAMRFRDRDLDPAIRVLPVMALNTTKVVLDVLEVTTRADGPGLLDHLFAAAQVLVGLWFIIALGFKRGTEGPNRFGEDPARLVQGRFPDGSEDRGRSG